MLTHPDQMSGVPGTTPRGVLRLITMVIWFFAVGIFAMVLEVADIASHGPLQLPSADTDEQ
ncbi:MAG: hypothetical protein JWL75_559 [Parcubacteria group bacterium]|nr:hypothetical protein [Parcubacteria group bacterium]